MSINFPNMDRIVRYGKMTFVNDLSGGEIRKKIDVFSNNTTRVFSLNESSHAITLSARSFSFTPSATVDQYYVGGLVDILNLSQVTVGFAICTNISGGVVTFDYTSSTVTNGTYYIFAVYPNEFKGTFMGDFVNGNEIQNVVLEWGTSKANMVGQIFYEPKYSSTGKLFKITAYNAGTNKFTISSTGSISAPTLSNIYFSDNTRAGYETNTDGNPAVATQTLVLQKNSKYVCFPNSDKERVFKITASGLNHGSPAATWVEE